MPARIVQIIRHGEKPDDLAIRHLSARGYERAQAIAESHARLFGPLDNLFAAADSANSVRSRETITPLAEALHLNIDLDWKAKECAELADRLLQKAAYDGKSILICWHHELIHELSRALGAHHTPRNWNSPVFDRIWRLEFTGGGEIVFHDLPQNLLLGDSTS